MAMIKIVLKADEEAALCLLAKRELRDPRAQAVFLIRYGLQKHGLLAIPDDTAVNQRSASEGESRAINGRSPGGE